MAEMKKLLSTFILSCLMLNLCVFAKSDGLTLKLIPFDDPESPFYLGNLTYDEKLQRMVNQSKARAHHLSSVASITTNHSMIIRPSVAVEPTFVVQVGIGTFRRDPSFMTYYLVLDTGSDLIWTQCEDCQDEGNQCFDQEPPVFSNSQSSSYRAIPCNDHRLCTNRRMCRGQSCTYHIDYLSKESSTGILAFEKFSFTTDEGRTEEIKVQFGCGYDQKKFHYKENNKIAGILGMGFSKSYSSFVRQIDYRDGRFSYCISPDSQIGPRQRPSFLRFGSDIPRVPQFRSTDLHEYPRDSAYYINLMDISIANRPLNIPSREFARLNAGSGFIIDSGSTVSHIAARPFQKLEQGIKSYFQRDSRIHKIDGKHNLDLCFSRRETMGFEHLPNMTFRFEGGDFEVQPKNLYILGDEEKDGPYFCLLILKSEDKMNILGAHQQRDQRITYETKTKKLHFSPEDCARNP